MLEIKKLETPNIIIKPLTNSQEIPFNLLQLADPSQDQIEAYLRTGTCHIAKTVTNTIVGVVVLDKINATTVEIKNIAVKESEQGKGLGKMLLEYSEKTSRDLGFQKIIIGTGNSSIGQLALYQKQGFEMERIEKNFFTKNYSEEIIENGILCKHMVILEKTIK